MPQQPNIITKLREWWEWFYGWLVHAPFVIQVLVILFAAYLILYATPVILKILVAVALVFLGVIGIKILYDKLK